MKKCIVCEYEKEDFCFRKWRRTCKDCINREKRNWSKVYYQKNKKTIKEKSKKYYNKNKEKISDLTKKYRKKNSEHIKRKKREYYYKTKNKDDFRERRREYKRLRLKNPLNRLNANISRGINRSLRSGKAGRSWESLVGYSVDDLKKHLEFLWEPWMNWENYGNPNGDHTNCWHIDHIKPISWFNLKTFEDPEFKKCWALSNLQPKEGKLNISKSNRYVG